MSAPSATPDGARRPIAGLRRFASPAYVALTIIVLIALVGPFLVGDPEAVGTGPTLAGPSLAHPMGTNEFGMDMMSRVVHAARLDLGVAVSASAIAVAIGMPLGALAAYRGGWLDNVVLRISESFQAFPVLLLGMAIIAALESSIPNLIGVIALVNIPVYVRLTRSAVVPLKESDFVLAARCAGHGTPRIVARHILPNVTNVVAAQFSVNCAWAIQILAGLSFIGVGVALPTAEWGAMVRGGADRVVYGEWWVAMFPGLAILVTVLTLNAVAERIRHGD
ncbi:ABC transporter permease [Egibacter rhizosphaerae]|uniref:ABC transporter permease n=1 Tax=Egibacter rhizosphaerae TaxID=1670831 RepID=A0A411YID1_9ACTN|nr:ABC transporter permease [Egibacter rhizosphaerae]QBI20846.1 ABC transporter permease [Egibacter rhizosphaerae]